MKKLLSIFSYIFHPLFMPVYTVLMFFWITAPYYKSNVLYVLLLQTLILTIFVPICFFYLLLAMKKIDSIMVSDIRQRKLPLAMHVVLLFVLTKRSLIPHVSTELYYFFWASIISSIIAIILIYVNKKASLHMVGISSLTVFVMGLSLHFQTNLIYTIAALLVCNGLVASSRLVMKAHTYEELLMGSLIGIVPQIVGGYFWV